MKRRRLADETSVINTRDMTKPRSFFKLMLSPISQSIKLRIPEKFANANYEELCTSRVAILKVPTGETWEVTLSFREEDTDTTNNKKNKNVWFGKGWHEFVKHYSIEYGYFMLFVYDGDMKFNVHIFDLTTCEISYQCHQTSDFRKENEVSHEDLDLEEEDDDDDNDNDNDSDFECLNSALSSSSDDCSEAKGVEFDEADEDEDDDDDDDSVATQDTLLADLPGWFGHYKELLNAVTVAGISIPKNSFFVVKIHAYSLQTGLYLNIPLPFSREYLGCSSRTTNASKVVKLEGADGMQWPVKCSKSRGKSVLGQGWIKFARHIRLAVGDICVFEVDSSDCNILKVEVVKNSKI